MGRGRATGNGKHCRRPAGPADGLRPLRLGRRLWLGRLRRRRLRRHLRRRRHDRQVAAGPPGEMRYLPVAAGRDDLGVPIGDDDTDPASLSIPPRGSSNPRRAFCHQTARAGQVPPTELEPTIDVDRPAIDVDDPFRRRSTITTTTACLRGRRSTVWAERKTSDLARGGSRAVVVGAASYYPIVLGRARLSWIRLGFGPKVGT